MTQRTSEIVIRAEGIGKRYELRHYVPEGGLRHALQDALNSLWKKDPARAARSREEFWALQDVSFEIGRGEVIGIVGRNGAGKSTLLKILSRITEPTRGRVRIRGRVASLLEVGTGFHAELTGRENVFLNGTILGMSRREIKAKFDEIVNFAEVEKFLDTPVKHYSSGMYVRLAFAVAAYLEPDILLVDEVLAVGDAQFQKKCLGKMQDVSQREGRTVLFVSHNMTIVTELCSRALHLDRGRLVREGPAREVVAAYYGSGIGSTAHFVPPEAAHQNFCNLASPFRLLSITLLNPYAGQFAVHWNEPLRLRCELMLQKPQADIIFNYAVDTPLGIRLFSGDHIDGGAEPVRLEPGRHLIDITIPNPLQPGEYLFEFSAIDLHHRGLVFVYPAVVSFEVLEISNDSATCLKKPGTLVNNLATWKIQNA